MRSTANAVSSAMLNRGASIVFASAVSVSNKLVIAISGSSARTASRTRSDGDRRILGRAHDQHQRRRAGR